MRRVALLHSGGKDSVLALAALRLDSTVQVVALVATFTEEADRLAMHRIRRSLLEAQAASLRCSLEVVRVPNGASNAVYEQRMNRVVEKLRGAGVEAIATGDLHLEAIRAYREAWLSRLGIQALFPLWGRPPTEVVHAFIAAGYRAMIICIDRERLPEESIGREIDQSWLDALPADVDPCGESGEYHSFVHDGPGFAFPVPLAERSSYRDGRFLFMELGLGPCSTCARCKAPFVCGAASPSQDCWCIACPPAELDSEQATCVCPRCLAQRRVSFSSPQRT
ncbi:MAG: ATP-binding protein [Burkholderiales bacterium]